MKKIVISLLLVALIAMSIMYAVNYGNLYLQDTGEIVYFCFLIYGILETVLSLIAFVLHLKEKNGRVATVVYCSTVLLCVPILLFSIVWMLHWSGFDLIPPPQR